MVSSSSLSEPTSSWANLAILVVINLIPSLAPLIPHQHWWSPPSLLHHRQDPLLLALDPVRRGAEEVHPIRRVPAPCSLRCAHPVPMCPRRHIATVVVAPIPRLVWLRRRRLSPSPSPSSPSSPSSTSSICCSLASRQPLHCGKEEMRRDRKLEFGPCTVE